MRTGFLISLLFGLLGLVEAEAQFFDEVSWPPQVEFVPSEGECSSGGTVEYGIKVKPDFGLHVYRDKLEVKLDGAKGVRLDEVILPGTEEIDDLLNPGEKVAVFNGEFLVKLKLVVTAGGGDEVLIKGILSLQGCSDEICYPPEDIRFEAPSMQALPGDGVPVPAEEKPAVSLGQILSMILTGFGAGILLSLTPCVLPMIPITSAIILRFSKGGIGSALITSCIYVLGMAITYAAAGVGVAFLGGQIRSAFNSPWFLGTVAVVFVLLSLSMFGVYDLAMPSGIAGKLQQRSAKAGKNRLGLVFMGMLSGLVVGPCVTAPIAGLLLLIANSGSPLVGFSTMFALAWGMGLLIILAGTFTGMVPKAGEWTEWFKKFFGFVMLWGGLYFIRSIIGDLAFAVGTAVLLVVASVFLGGFDSLPSDAKWGLRLKKLIGVFCIMGALFMGINTLIQHAGLPVSSTDAVRSEGAFVPGGSSELETAMDQERAAVLYFTADWCDICKKLKSETLTQPEVAEALDGVLALKVDFDASQDLVDRFKVPGPPTLVFINKQGEEATDLRTSGFISPEDLVERIRRL